MKHLLSAILVFSIMLLASFNALASDREVKGLLFGSGAGAIVGQALGRNVESTVIGATIGGVLGAIIGQDHHSSQLRIHHYPQERRQYNRIHHQNTPRRFKPRSSKKHYSQTCKEVTTYSRNHRNNRKVVKTTCRNERPRNRGKRYSDHNYRFHR